MAQNIYDQQDFFVEYNKLPRAAQGLGSAPEWATMRQIVGDVRGCRVLDLGCGAGWFCRWAAESGAESIHGIDISKNMLDRAHTFTYNPKVITYECKDLETLTLPEATYDLVYSALAFHYLPDLGSLFAQIAHCLKPGGRLAFFVEHPVTTAPSDPNWKADDQGHVFWPLNQYLDEGLRITTWLGAEDVRKYHHSVETYLSKLIENGFVLKAYRESWEGLSRKTVPDKQGEAHRPYFLLIGAQIPESK